MQNCAIVGINWGDEGKGRMVDLLTEDFDVVVRAHGRFHQEASHFRENSLEGLSYVFICNKGLCIKALGPVYQKR